MTRPAILALLFLIASSCAPLRDNPTGGLSKPARVKVEPWSFGSVPGRKLITPHYVIYTTMTDADVLAGVAQVMEGALSQYRRLAPDVLPSGQPMACYLFQTREQWAAFTHSRTGADAAVYLQINRGGYTVRDWYVAYFIGDLGTYSVAAHEGFHQYVARHFRSRLPPFLEEGLACMFEEIGWESGRGGPLPRWNFATSRSRLAGLRSAYEGGYLVPLEQLAATHAGQVVDQPAGQIEAFYAQSWAFARFLWAAEGGKYRPTLRRILAEAAGGSLFNTGTSRRNDDGLWDPESASPLLEHYLGADLREVDRSFRKYIQQLVVEGYRGVEG